jgi:hypothetical protein
MVKFRIRVLLKTRFLTPQPPGPPDPLIQLAKTTGKGQGQG